MVLNKDVTKNGSLYLSISNQNKHILRPTKCPTIICKDCKRKYVDRLGLDILVICNCKCHMNNTNEKEPFNIGTLNFYDNCNCL